MDTCFFCGKEPKDWTCTIELPVYRLKQYTHWGVARKFAYEKAITPVPRCMKCARLHRRTKIYHRLGFVAGVVVGFVLYCNAKNPNNFLLAPIVGGLLGRWVSRVWTRKRYHQLQIKALKPVTFESYPPVVALGQAGWRLENPGGSIFSKKGY